MLEFNHFKIGERIKLVRGRYNQAEFGRKLGLSQAKLSLLETGRVRRPQAEVLFKICMLSDPPINLQWLVTGIGTRHVGRSIDVDPNVDTRFELLISQIRELKKEGDYVILGKIQELVGSKE
jgi:transcriptional regulator with XRE-family HTH domain